VVRPCTIDAFKPVANTPLVIDLNELDGGVAVVAGVL
jgi:hypothetical protein